MAQLVQGLQGVLVQLVHPLLAQGRLSDVLQQEGQQLLPTLLVVPIHLDALRPVVEGLVLGH